MFKSGDFFTVIFPFLTLKVWSKLCCCSAFVFCVTRYVNRLPALPLWGRLNWSRRRTPASSFLTRLFQMCCSCGWPPPCRLSGEPQPAARVRCSSPGRCSSPPHVHSPTGVEVKNVWRWWVSQVYSCSSSPILVFSWWRGGGNTQLTLKPNTLLGSGIHFGCFPGEMQIVATPAAIPDLRRRARRWRLCSLCCSSVQGQRSHGSEGSQPGGSSSRRIAVWVKRVRAAVGLHAFKRFSIKLCRMSCSQDKRSSGINCSGS